MKVKEAEEMIRVRLSTVMRQKRITPSILARKTGISESVIRGYIQEGVIPTAGRLEVKMNFLNYGEPEYLEANSKAMKNLAMAYTLVKRGVMLPDYGREFRLGV